MTFIAALELRHVQGYVFSTNRLLDIVGRSATLAGFTDPNGDTLKGLLEMPGRSQLGYGAASVVVKTDTEADAKAFLAALSRKVRDSADSAHIVTAIVDETTGGATPATVAAALLKARAWHEAAHLPTPSFGFTADCAVSGLPATEVTSDDLPRGREILSAEVIVARDRGRTWHDTQEKELLDGAPAPNGVTWKLPLELDDIADTKGDFSQLAVMHLDINGLGATLQEYLAEVDRDPFEAARDAGAAIASVMRTLARHLIHTVTGAAAKDEDGRIWVTGFPEQLQFPVMAVKGSTAEQDASKNGEFYVPLRPIITAGDEMTLVCDARLAWSLAQAAIRWWDEPIGSPPNNDPRRALFDQAPRFQRRFPDRLGLTFSIGIAMFRAGSPLTVAYERAAALTKTAKEVRRRGSHCVAWSLETRTPEATVSDILDRREKNLTIQPCDPDHLFVLLDDALGENGMRSPAQARNKIKALTRTSALLARRSANGRGANDDMYLAALQRDARPLLDIHLALGATATGAATEHDPGDAL